MLKRPHPPQSPHPVYPKRQSPHAPGILQSAETHTQVTLRWYTRKPLLILLIDPHLLRILADITLNRFFNGITFPTRNAEDEIIERGATEDIDVVA